jgi:hypothetical protein
MALDNLMNFTCLQFQNGANPKWRHFCFWFITKRYDSFICGVSGSIVGSAG